MTYYEDDNTLLEDDGGESEEFSGYTVYDDDEIYRRKILAAAVLQEEEETIASPIPQNEQKVIVDNAIFFGLTEGTDLDLVLSATGGYVEFNGKKVGDLKPAFVAKLKETRDKSYVKTSLYTIDPPMVKLEFNESKTKGYSIQITKG